MNKTQKDVDTSSILIELNDEIDNFGNLAK